MTITITLLALCFWAATLLTISWRLRQRIHQQTPARHTLTLNGLWVIALLLHGLTLIMHFTKPNATGIDFTTAASIVMWLTSLLLFITHLTRPLEAMGLFIIPVTMLTLILAQWLPHNTSHIAINHGLGIHILLSLMAYSLLTLAAIQALLLAWQNRLLHNHHPGGLLKTLPPLLDMEALLFKLITLGLVLLTAGLITGFLFLDNLFGSGVAHKTLFALTAWCVFALLILGHWRWGWRGKTAIRWTLGGFTLLMLAYFGSKFVLEFLV